MGANGRFCPGGHPPRSSRECIGHSALVPHSKFMDSGHRVSDSRANLRCRRRADRLQKHQLESHVAHSFCCCRPFVLNQKLTQVLFPQPIVASIGPIDPFGRHHGHLRNRTIMVVNWRLISRHQGKKNPLKHAVGILWKRGRNCQFIP
jgi:hypothetical protein